MFDFALSQVRSHSDEMPVDMDKVQRLKAQIQAGEHPAQNSNNTSFFESLSEKILSTEYDHGK